MEDNKILKQIEKSLNVLADNMKRLMEYIVEEEIEMEEYYNNPKIKLNKKDMGRYIQ